MYLLMEMQIKITKENQAVAGVIEALLLVALVAIVISIIQLQYIPQVMEQREAEHMDEISNQFSTLKSMIDTQALAGSIATNAPLAHVAMSSMITLGSRALPYFITAPSFGELSIVENNNYKMELFPPTSPPSFPLTSIQFHADNSYFVDQTYALEGGGIILNQSTGDPVMRADPSLSAAIVNDYEMKIHFYLPIIEGVTGKNVSDGIGKCFVRTNFSSNDSYSYLVGTIEPSYEIRFFTSYLNAWNESLNRLLGDAIKQGYIQVFISQTPAPHVKILPEQNKLIDFEITVVKISAQIGPGWVI